MYELRFNNHSATFSSALEVVKEFEACLLSLPEKSAIKWTLFIHGEKSVTSEDVKTASKSEHSAMLITACTLFHLMSFRRAINQGALFQLGKEAIFAQFMGKEYALTALGLTTRFGSLQELESAMQKRAPILLWLEVQETKQA